MAKYKFIELGFKNYREYLQSDHWKEIKWLYRNSDYPQYCLACSGKQYDLHHRTYKRLGAEWKSDLVPICRDCHNRIHEYFDKHPNATVGVPQNRYRKDRDQLGNKVRQTKTKKANISLWHTDHILSKVFGIKIENMKKVFSKFECYQPWIPDVVPQELEGSIDDQIMNILDFCRKKDTKHVKIEDWRIIKLFNENERRAQVIRDVAARNRVSIILAKL